MRGTTPVANKYETLYRHRAAGERFPKIGDSPSVAQPGDLVSFFEGGQYTRVVKEVKGNLIHTEPLMDKDPPRKIKFDDVAEIMRKLSPQAPEPPVAPPPEPPVAPPPEPPVAPPPEPPVAAPEERKPLPASRAKPRREPKRPRTLQPLPEPPPPVVESPTSDITDEDLDDWLGSFTPDR
jgi:hypothetical protein